MAKKKIIQPTTAAPVKSYKHDAKRARIPTQEESIKLSARDKQPIKKRYDYDPDLTLYRLKEIKTDVQNIRLMVRRTERIPDDTDSY